MCILSNMLGVYGYVCCNITFNNISVISWRSIWLMELTEIPGETTALLQFIEKF
jgi:hypothetical protein